jgi:hypothetical protein
MKCRHWTLSFARLVAEMQVAARTGALWLAVRARWLAWGGQGSYRCSPDGLTIAGRIVAGYRREKR